MKNYHSESIKDCLVDLGTGHDGLSSSEAGARLTRYGYNQLDLAKEKSVVFKFFNQFKDLMILILLVASLISIVIGFIEGTTSEIVDGVIILGIVFINATLGFVQEHRAEKALEALKKMTEPEAIVVRGGNRIKVSTNKLVPGDIVVLEAGTIVPADIRLIETASLKCNEASLTGESNSVQKEADILCKEKSPLADRKNMAFCGSVVAGGRGLGVVSATGKNTEIGKIAEIIKNTEKDDSPLQKSLNTIGRIVTYVVLLLAALVFILEVVFRPNSSVIEAFLTAVAISVAAIPESMPAVITIIMSMGVARLSRQKAIVKRLSAVETLGSCEIICSDKTGTITQNVMTVKDIFTSNQHELLLCSVLCNDSKKSENRYMGDPTETALCDFAEKFGYIKKHLEIEYPRVGEVPFDSSRKRMITIHKKGLETITYVKGAVDVMISSCTHILEKDSIREIRKEDIDRIEKANADMAKRALRVLCMAKGFNEKKLTFIGLVGMIDPPRKEVFAAVSKCKKAGMRPVMITGDHRDTAFAIAKEVGICTQLSQVMTGAEMDALSDDEFLKKLARVSVFARVSPENKVRIVEAFKKQGKTVAMTGDGVNDAPSMKAASIGVGMGISGTDVTKEVADIIVTDDNFASIVVAVEEGRKIYDNIQKTVKYLFSANMAEILALLLATLIFPQYTFLFPVQILFVNLITDSLPAIALGFEPVERNVMEEPPRSSKKHLLSGSAAWSIIVLGIVQTAIVFGAFMIGLNESQSVAVTMAFLSLNITEILFIYSARTKGYLLKSNPFQNKWVNYAVLAAFGALMLIIFSPLSNVLKIEQIGFLNWLIVFVMSFSVIIFAELFKFVCNKVKI